MQDPPPSGLTSPNHGDIRFWRLFGALIVGVGWLAFITSFFLPATNVVERGGTSPGTPLVGWDAAISSIRVLAAQPLVFVVEPRAWLFLIFPLLNLGVLLSPAVAVSMPKKVGWLALVLLPAAIVPQTLPKTLTGDLFVGFYVWIGSFVTLAVGYILISLTASTRGPGRQSVPAPAHPRPSPSSR